MTRRQAKIRALEVACAVLHSASTSWPMDDGDSLSDKELNWISKDLDAMAQQMFNRAEDMKERTRG